MNEWLAKIKGRWGVFIYNYRWSDWVPYIDGWVPKFALFVPILGYLVLFNDQFSEYFEFTDLANEDLSDFGLSAIVRLRMIYFGLIFLGLSNFTYRFTRPYMFRFGSNILDFTKTGLDFFNYTFYRNIHEQIRKSDPYTQDGKYYDSEWEGFVNSSLNKNEGTDNVKYSGNWEEGKLKYGSLLRSMLSEHFFANDIQGRKWLTFCIFLSSAGYTLLVIPSADIFVKVIRLVFFT